MTSAFKDCINIYEEISLRALEKDHNIQAGRIMIYECEKCHSGYIMQLEEGLETDAPNSKSIPYSISCICCTGRAKRILLHQSDQSNKIESHFSYFKYLCEKSGVVYRNFFMNDPRYNHGTPVLFEPDYYNRICTPIQDAFLDQYIKKDIKGIKKLIKIFKKEKDKKQMDDLVKDVLGVIYNHININIKQKGEKK